MRKISTIINESVDENEFLIHFAEIKDIYSEFKYHISIRSEGSYTVDFSTRHNHRFNFDKFLEIQSLITSKLQEINKSFIISRYELEVDNYNGYETESDSIYHVDGRVVIKSRN